MITPRPYQIEAVNAILREWRDGVTRQIVSLPTGSGKTIVFGMLAKELRCRALVLAHREELLTQAVTKMKLVDPSADIGILQAENDHGYFTNVCVASVQTAARGKRIDVLKERNFKLCIVDEAHHGTAETYHRIIRELGFMSGNASNLLVGVTATAYRGDNVALGEVFEKIVFERTIMAMMKGGYLCDARGVSVKTGSDLSDVHTRAGDFALGELSDVIDIPARNKLIAESYLEHCTGRRAVAFCCDVAHAHNLAGVFSDAGVRVAPVWGDMDKDERRRVLAAYSAGDIDVLTNCAVLTEGWDDPGTAAIMLARPTKSRVLYTQMVGRGLRLYPGKLDCLVVDFADVAGRHNLCGLATLAGDPRIKPKTKQTLLEAVEEFEQLEADRDEWKRARVGDVVREEFDLFGRSNFVWAPVQGGHFRLPISATESIWVRREGGGYMVWLLDRTNLSNKKPLSDDVLPLGYAQGMAEDYVRINAETHLVDRNAKWRGHTASEKQLELLAKWRIPHDRHSITAGEASQLIDIEIARREASWSEPATHKQRWFIVHRLGVAIPDDLTKKEASRIIAEKKMEVAV